MTFSYYLGVGMSKEKIAISLSEELLKDLDKKIDGSVIRSRSQAIELFVKKGIEERMVDTAVIMLSKRHHGTALSGFKGSILIKKQIEFFRGFDINNIIILTQSGGDVERLRKECDGIANIIITDAKKNGDALKQLKNEIKRDFLVISGDIYNDFDLNAMIKKHMVSNRIATIGLMTRAMPSKYGVASLDGDLVVDFKEKQKKPSSHVVNAGIYIFGSGIFDFMKGRIEEDVLPRLAKMKQLVGFFTTGEYVHFDEL